MIGLIPIGDAFCAAAACAICCRYSAAILLRCWLISINCGELFITSGENGNGCCINNWFCPTRGNPGFKGHCGVVGVIDLCLFNGGLVGTRLALLIGNCCEANGKGWLVWPKRENISDTWLYGGSDWGRGMGGIGLGWFELFWSDIFKKIGIYFLYSLMFLFINKFSSSFSFNIRHQLL